MSNWISVSLTYDKLSKVLCDSSKPPRAGFDKVSDASKKQYKKMKKNKKNFDVVVSLKTNVSKEISNHFSQ